MIFWVEDEIFGAHVSREVDRISLLKNTANRKHSLVISDSPDNVHYRIQPEHQPHFRRWVNSLHQELQKEIIFLEENIPLNTVM